MNSKKDKMSAIKARILENMQEAKKLEQERGESIKNAKESLEKLKIYLILDRNPIFVQKS